MAYGQIDQPTKSKNMLDKYIDAYRNYMITQTVNPNYRYERIPNSNPAFENYFGGSNSNTSRPIILGDLNTEFMPNTPVYLIKPQGGNR